LPWSVSSGEGGSVYPAYPLEQTDRRYGHVLASDLVDVHVLTWGHIISEARTRFEYIKEKLNLNLMDNEKNLDYLKTKYREYLPKE